MSTRVQRADTARLAWWQPWAALAGFALLLHVAWESLQAPLDVGMEAGAHGPATRACALATLGDAAITLVAYGAVAALARDRAWGLVEPTGRAWRRRLGAYLVAGEAVTVALELLNVHVLERWAYGPGMGAVAGVGVAPLAQWLLVPPLVLWLARRHVAGGITHHLSHPAAV